MCKEEVEVTEKLKGGLYKVMVRPALLQKWGC